MDASLLTNVAEFNDFCNLKAKGRIINLERAISAYSAEIEETLNICGKILSDYGSDVNYIAEIYNLDIRIHELEKIDNSGEERDDLLKQRDALEQSKHAFLANLPLNIKEDIEFYSKRINDRSLRLYDANETQKEIESTYPEAKNIIISEIFKKSPTLRAIKSYLNPVELEETFELDVIQTKDETLNLPYVTKISKAPEHLISVDLTTTMEEIVADELIISSDNSFYDPTDDFTSEIESEKMVPIFADENISEKESEDELTYIMQKGDSLVSIAIALCDDENGWYDLYNANKETIENRIKENEISTDKIEFNDEVFIGLKINIPNIFTKKADNSIKLVA